LLADGRPGSVEVRDWVLNLVAVQLPTVDGALAVLHRFDPLGKWSVEVDEDQSYLFTGGFASFVTGVAAATALLRQ
jgi:hypothetical protein